MAGIRLDRLLKQRFALPRIKEFVGKGGVGPAGAQRRGAFWVLGHS